MSFSIGAVFAKAWAVTKERFWGLLALWAVFFGIQIIASTVLGTVIGGSALAFGFAAGPGFEPSEAALGGFGVGIIILMLLFYIGYFWLIFAQQGAMTAMASPTENLRFGDAMSLGFRSGLTFLGVMIALGIAYFGLAAVAAVLIALTSVLGDAAPIIAAILLVPVAIYLALRFAVLVPVIAVERIFNPVTALRRAWSVTSGHVLAIFVLYAVFTLLAGLALGLPILALFGMDFGASPEASVAAIGSVLVIILLMIPLYIAFTIASCALNAALHGEISNRQDIAAEFE